MGKKDNIIRRVEGIDEKELLESMADCGRVESKTVAAPVEKEIRENLSFVKQEYSIEWKV